MTALQQWPSDRVALFLGAGISVGMPSGGPLFADIRDACVHRAGVDAGEWSEDDPRRLALDHVIPEVFLKGLVDAGYELARPLAHAVEPEGDNAWNASHELAADILDAGGTVWTTNWDCRIEAAHASRSGRMTGVAVFPSTGPPHTSGMLAKLHGCASDPSSLRFASTHVMSTLPGDWHGALVESCRNRTLFVAGYGGADIDVFPALQEAMSVADAVFWFEGVTSSDPCEPATFEGSELAGYEVWRFSLDTRALLDTTSLPSSGRHLVWCGDGQDTVANPSGGLLHTFGRNEKVGPPRPRHERLASVQAAVASGERRQLPLTRRMMLSADIHTRLGARPSAAARYAVALVFGTTEEKRKAARQIANLALLRRSRFRRVANAATVSILRNADTKRFLRLHSGNVDHDISAAADVAANGAGSRPVGVCLDLAMNSRWVGDLTVGEGIARDQLARAVRMNEEGDRQHDWPEQIARSAYELGQSLAWQGRLTELDDVCRSAYMRAAGSKFVAWEYSLRAVGRFAAGDYCTADDQLDAAIRLLHLDGFEDFTPTLVVGRAACHRMRSSPRRAAELLEEAADWPSKSAGTVAAVTAERAEQQIAGGSRDAAVATWTELVQSELPLWQSLGFLRLAETAVDPGGNGEAALAGFTRVSSQWGAIRSRACVESWGEDEVTRRTQYLGPHAVYVPNGPWYF